MKELINLSLTSASSTVDDISWWLACLLSTIIVNISLWVPESKHLDAVQILGRGNSDGYESITLTSRGLVSIDRTLNDHMLIDPTLIDRTLIGRMLIARTLIDHKLIDNTLIGRSLIDRTWIDHTLVNWLKLQLTLGKLVVCNR